MCIRMYVPPALARKLATEDQSHLAIYLADYWTALWKCCFLLSQSGRFHFQFSLIGRSGLFYDQTEVLVVVWIFQDVLLNWLMRTSLGEDIFAHSSDSFVIFVSSFFGHNHSCPGCGNYPAFFMSLLVCSFLVVSAAVFQRLFHSTNYLFAWCQPRTLDATIFIGCKVIYSHSSYCSIWRYKSMRLAATSFMNLFARIA